MVRLKIRLLGTPQVWLDGRMVTDFVSNKARALLYYLAVEQERPFRREALAGLLWPGHSDARARANLRRALSSVRRAIDDSSGRFLRVSRQELQFIADSASSVDIIEFNRLLRAPQQSPAQIETAVDLVHGDFLHGFSIGDSVAFDEWALLQREGVRQRALGCLTQLVNWYAAHHHDHSALRFAQRLTALDPWYEPGQRQLLRLLARSGRRQEALRHFDAFAESLANELSLSPESETVELIAQIRDDAFLSERSGTPPFVSLLRPNVPAPFVARQKELTDLDRHLAHALRARGRIVLLEGEAGSGKTRLLHEFAQRAQQLHPRLIPMLGIGYAHVGPDDPLLPIRAMLGHAVGDIQSLWLDGTLSRLQAERMWAERDAILELLQQVAPDCLNLLVDSALLPQAMRHPQPAGVPSRSALFRQFTRFLQRLSGRGPLLLMFDDLQWIDTDSIDLLLYLQRELTAFPILVLGTYRPEEVTLVPDDHDQQHPLARLIHTLRRVDGEDTLSLEAANGWSFIAECLDLEPNRLDDAFRAALYRKTKGHALFTVELIAGMRDRGELIRDQDGYWRATSTISWDEMPIRVEAVIAQRVARLPSASRALLAAASILGERFPVEPVAKMIGRPPEDVIATLAGHLSRIHRLVEPQSRSWIGNKVLTHYRFRHALYRQYFYDGFDAIERSHYHGIAGELLEQTYTAPGINRRQVAAQLAWHFGAAGNARRAIDYRLEAGDFALQLSAHRDAVAHLRRGLALNATLPESAERMRQELELQIKLGSALVQTEGYGAATVRTVYERIHALAEGDGLVSHQATALFWLASHRAAGGELLRALQLAQRVQTVSRDLSYRELPHVLAHTMTGLLLFLLGRNVDALTHLRQAADLYDADRHQPHVHAFGQDPGIGAMIWQGHVLLHMGQRPEANRCLQRALDWSDALDHPYTRAFTLLLAGCAPNIWYHRHPELAKRYAQSTLALATASHFNWLQALATFYDGYCDLCTATTRSDRWRALERMGAGLRLEEAIGNLLGRSSRLLLLAVGQHVCSRDEAALATLERAEALIERTEERYFAAEIQRIKGGVLDACGRRQEAGVCWRRAQSIAQSQHAALWLERVTARNGAS